MRDSGGIPEMSQTVISYVLPLKEWKQAHGKASLKGYRLVQPTCTYAHSRMYVRKRQWMWQVVGGKH